MKTHRLGEIVVTEYNGSESLPPGQHTQFRATIGDTHLGSAYSFKAVLALAHDSLGHYLAQLREKV